MMYYALVTAEEGGSGVPKEQSTSESSRRTANVQEGGGRPQPCRHGGLAPAVPGREPEPAKKENPDEAAPRKR